MERLRRSFSHLLASVTSTVHPFAAHTQVELSQVEPQTRIQPKVVTQPQTVGQPEAQTEDWESRALLFQAAMDAAPHGVMITAHPQGIVYRNQALLRLFELPDSALGPGSTEWKEVMARRMKAPERLINFLELMLAHEVGETLDILERTDGRLIECRTRFLDTDLLGAPYRLWGFLDCTEQHRHEAELQRLGMHDTLTGLYNRGFFDMKLRQLRLADFYPVCMFMIDVDGLKRVNDQQGHAAGDQLLRQASLILRQACRTEDIVARLGGDEFALLLSRASAEVAEQVSNRIQGLLNLYNMRHPEEPISLSSGYAVANNAREIETLFDRADQSMYEARRVRRARQG